MLSNTIITETNNFFIEELLSQEGIPYEVSQDLAQNNRPSAIWILNNERPAHHKIQKIKHLMNTGNIILCDNTIYRYVKPHIKNTLPESCLISLPFAVNDYIDAFISVKKAFTAEETEVKERVALKNRRAPRENLTDIIKKIFFDNHLPYIHLWYYPDGYDSIFSFKVDLDEYYKEDIENLIDYGKEFAGSITWFACCNVIDKDSSLIKSLINSGYDIQSHGYFHHIYNNPADNILNIKRSLDLLKKYGLNVTGFSGPMGKWNKALLITLNTLGIEYSSEFGFDYDNLPSFAASRELKPGCLQIPVHPVCLGSFIEAGIKDKAAGYFNRIIEYKYNNKEPILLYGHPERRLGRNKEFFINLMINAYSLHSVKKMNFSQVSAWWLERKKNRFSVNYTSPNKLRITSGSRNNDLCYRIELPENKEAFIKSHAGEIGLETLNFRPVLPKKSYYQERILPPAIKDRIKDILDWDDVTPLVQTRRKKVIRLLRHG